MNASDFHSASPRLAGMTLRDGVFYVYLRLWGRPLPLEIALHGISDRGHALKAAQMLCKTQEPAKP